jgi:hypothetical protein
MCAEVARRAGGQHHALSNAVAARRAQRSPETLRRLRWALHLDPDLRPERDDLEASLMGGHLLGDLSRLREAASWFARALELEPEHVEARALHAWTRWLHDLDPRWRDEIEALARAHPDDPLLTDLSSEMAAG